MQASIENYVEELLKLITRGELPFAPTKQNRKSHNFVHIARFLAAAQVVHDMQVKQTSCKKRDLYYRFPRLFESQLCSNRTLENLAVVFQCHPTRMGVHGSERGVVVGHLSFQFGNETIECVPLVPRMIPSTAHEITSFTSCASFLLIVEKDTVFQRLIDTEFTLRHRCVLVTGKGYPCFATRSFLFKFHACLPSIPLLILTDANPHGLEIASVYKFGSSIEGEERIFQLPALTWLGLKLSEVDLTSRAVLEMTATDRAKISTLQKCPLLPFDWKQELEFMEKCGKKCDIEYLSSENPTGIRELIEDKLVLLRCSQL
eukprot:c4939_g1_i1.p1 GENE.c4939_g1_i1~~c4939_g1_i1.p1  ORF type:complete len:317 (+),score=58.42 c4939_g1_i1:82-1032(+)